VTSRARITPLCDLSGPRWLELKTFSDHESRFTPLRPSKPHAAGSQIRAASLDCYRTGHHREVHSSPSLVRERPPTLSYQRGQGTSSSESYLDSRSRLLSGDDLAECGAPAASITISRTSASRIATHVLWILLGNFVSATISREKTQSNMVGSDHLAQGRLPKKKSFTSLFKGEKALKRDTKRNDLWSGRASR